MHHYDDSVDDGLCNYAVNAATERRALLWKVLNDAIVDQLCTVLHHDG